MPLIINNFYDATKKTEWSWPLKIAVHTYNPLFIKAMAEHDQYSQFTHIHPVAKILKGGKKERVAGTTARGKYDILLIIDDGKSDIASFRSIAANYIIVCQLTPADEIYATYNERHNGLIRWFLKNFSASGLLFFPNNHNPSNFLAWYGSFIKSLSENNSIADAIQATVKTGCLMHTTTAAAEKPLEKGFILMADRFKKLYDQNYSLPGRKKDDLNMRRQLDAVKTRISSGSGFERSGNLLTAGDITQIYHQLGELQEMVKMRQVKRQAISTIVKKSHSIEKFNELPPSKDKDVVNTRREVISFSQESPRTAVVSDMEDLVRVMPKPQKRTVQDPRYLQAGIATEQAPGVSVKNYLEPATNYKLSVSIGRRNEGLIVSDELFPADDILLDVRMPEEPLTIIFQPSGEEEPQSQTLLLPKLQDSLTVDFNFHTADTSTEFSADILASHKNRLIQILHLAAPVKHTGDDTTAGEIALKTTFTARRNLDGLSNRLEFDLALHYEEQDGQPVVIGVIEKKPVKFNSGDGLRDTVDHIKRTIERAAYEPADYPHDLDNANNQALLVKLAVSGAKLYSHLIQGKVTGDGPLQVVANRAVFAPFDFVYTLPAPKFTAMLCKHAKEALISGRCLDCFDKSEQLADHICPYGFWGYSRVIERFKYNKESDDALTTDLLVYSEPATGRNTLNILQNTIHGSSNRVNVGDPERRKKVADFLQDNSSTITVENWNDWALQTAATQPETIVLITHIQHDKDFNVDHMEIGGDLLAQVHLNSNHLLEEKKPFAIVIGCEVDNIKNQGFDVSSEFLNKGAAIVITNFNKISGKEAAIIVMRLVELLKADGSDSIQLGAVVLKLKQQLLAEGLMSSLSLTVYGDADWMISTNPKAKQ